MGQDALFSDHTYATLHDHWQDTFRTQCFNSEPFGWALLHLTIGQLPNVRHLRIDRRGDDALDMRIHVCYLAESGSGKGKGAEVFMDIAEAVDVAVLETSQYTDAALIGTVSRDADGDLEFKPGLLSGVNQVFDPNPPPGAPQVTEETFNVLYMSEASSIVKERPREHEQLIMNFLQQAMNPYGTRDNYIRKILASGPSFGYNTDVSILLTTFPPTAFTDVLLQRGLFQRALLVVKQVTNDDHKRAMKSMIRSFRATEVDKVGEERMDPFFALHYQEKVRVVADYLRSINEFAAGVDKMRFEGNALIAIDRILDSYYDQIHNVPPFLQAKVREFISRIAEHLMRLSAHIALSFHESTVREAHVGFLEHHIAKQHFESLITYLTNNIDVPPSFLKRYVRQSKILLKAFEITGGWGRYDNAGGRAGWRRTDDIVRSIREENRYTQQAARYLVEEFIGYNVLEAGRTKKGTDIIRVAEAPDVGAEDNP